MLTKVTRPSQTLLLLTTLIVISGICIADIGTIEGAFNVKSTGASTYRVPINLAPGLNGLEPKVSLTYDSLSGNGPLGVGWRLSATSHITRCPSDLIRDGVIDPIDFDSNDQFCLDGIRLIYGSDGFFRPELDGSTKILMLGSRSNPQGFHLFTGDGQTKYYGTVSNSQTQHQGYRVRWSLGKTEDRFSNTIEYNYWENGFGYKLLDNIIYNNQMVNFVYEGLRVDPANIRLAKGMSKYLKEKMTAVELYNSNGVLFDRYNIEYEKNDSKQLSIKRIERCNQTCLKPSEFSLAQELFQIQQNTGPTTYIEDDSNQAKTDLKRTLVGDFNGDGIEDLYRIEGAGGIGQDIIYLFDGDGNHTIKMGPYTNIGSGAYAELDISRYKVVDLNGDRISDIYYDAGWGNNNQASLIYLFDQNANHTVVQGPITHIDGNLSSAKIDLKRTLVGDFNGDGIQDLYRIEGAGSAANDLLFLFNESGQYQIVQGPATHVGGPGLAEVDINRFSIGDFNGDGIHDVYYNVGWGSYSNPDIIYLFDHNGNHSVVHGPTTYVGSSYDGALLDIKRHIYGDFNGDSITDVYRIEGWGSNTQDSVYLFNSQGGHKRVNGPHTFISGSIGGAFTDIQRFHFGDFNGDRVGDIYFDNGWGNATPSLVYLFEPNGSFAVVNGPSTYIEAHHDTAKLDLSRTFTGDFNSDGITDLYRIEGAGGIATDRIFLWNADGTFDEKTGPATNIGSGDGATVDIVRFKKGDFNGDGRTDVYYDAGWGNNNQASLVYTMKSQQRPVKIFSNGLVETHVDYENLAQSTQYTRTTQVIGDNIPISHQLPVVTGVTITHGNYTDSFDYEYDGLKFNRRFKKLLGFERRSVIEANSGLRTNTFFTQVLDSRLVELPFVEEVFTAGGTLLSYTHNGYVSVENQGVYFIGKSQSSTTRWELDGSLVGTAAEENHFTNNYGYPYNYAQYRKRTCSSVSQGAIGIPVVCDSMTSKVDDKIIDKTFYNESNFGFYHSPKVSQTRVTSTLFGVSLPLGQSTTQTRTESFDYFTGSGALKTKTIEPNNPSLKMVQQYTYSPQGQLLDTTTFGGSGVTSVATRTTTNVYETHGQHRLVEKINALGHVEKHFYENGYFPWLVTRVTDPSDLSITTEYDNFQRAFRVSGPYSQSSETTLNWCHNGCGIGASYYSSTVSNTKPNQLVYFDALGRSIQESIQVLSSGTTVEFSHSKTYYDALGRVASVSEPFFHGEAEVNTTTEYDILDRPTKITDPLGNTIEYDYFPNEVKTTFTPSDGDYIEVFTKKRNALGQIVEEINPEGNSIYFQHDPFGNLVKTRDHLGNEIHIKFDVKGRKIQQIDPDMGNWFYTYFADGNVRTQKNAKNQVTEYVYDKLERMVQKQNIEGISSWIYDNCTNGKGKLCQKTNGGDYTQTYHYNSLGQNYKTVTSISGMPNATAETIFDSFGRPEITLYPGLFRIKNIYSSIVGTLDQIVDDNTQASLWKANEHNARGQVTQFSQGGNITTSLWYEHKSGRLEEQRVFQNGAKVSEQNYIWKANGNLDNKADYWRSDASKTLNEYYEYDVLRRLTDYSTDVGGSRLTTINMNYDSMGNIKFKSDVGTYQYESSRPHAVTNISGIGSVAYDSNGNVTSGYGRTISYTSFNKPKTLSKAGVTTNISYGPDNNRYRRVDSGATSSTTFYVGPYEQEVKNGKTYHRLSLGSHVLLEKEDGVLNTVYKINDYLGSLVGTISTRTGAKRTNFDPWGNRRNLNIYDVEMLNIDLVSLMNHETQRGFTGHEHLSGVGIIHQNGRVYDPVLAKFMSPDPYIQAPTNLQSHNRYSYVWNNPTSSIDPSGYWRISLGPLGDIKGDTPQFLKEFESAIRNGIISILEETAELLGEDYIEVGVSTNGEDVTYHAGEDSGGQLSYTPPREEEQPRNASETRILEERVYALMEASINATLRGYPETDLEYVAYGIFYHLVGNRNGESALERARRFIKQGKDQACTAAAAKICALQEDLDKRWLELELNPLNLPYRIGPGEALRHSVRGHITEINRQESILRRWENIYDYMGCGGGDNCGPPSGGALNTDISVPVVPQPVNPNTPRVPVRPVLPPIRVPILVP